MPEIEEKSELEMIRSVEPAPVDDEKKEDEIVDEKPAEEEKPLEASDEKIHPSWSKISAEYPDFFKKFPEIRDLIGREKAYNELLTSVEDAKDVVEKAGDFDALAEKLSEGDLTPVMASLEEGSLAKLATNFLPSLAKQNEDLYYKITAPVIDQLLKAAFREGKLKDDENLANAAFWVSKWALGDGKFATGDAAFNPPTAEPKKDEKLEKEKEEFKNEKYSTFREGVLEGCNTQIDQFITKDLKDLSPRVQKLVLREIREELATQLQNDAGHMSRLRSLWKRAESVSYVGDIKSRIITTYLERAKSLAPAITEKVRKEIASEKESTSPTISLSGGPGKVGAGPIDPKRIDWSKTTELDAIRGKVALKGN